MPKSFASFSFGCRVNQAEREELDRQLIIAGFKYTQTKPSFYIINTCAVTQKAEREARQHIYQTKRKFPQTKIIVTGCAATKWINEKKRFEGVDRLIDNVNKEYIAQYLASRGIALQRQGDALDKTTDKYFSSKRFILKIQDGCQRFCTFCIVPYLRGQPHSRSIKYLVSSIKYYYEKEIKEVILTAINTQAFGFDTGESFINLISNILNLTSVPRISFGSIHPWSINDDFFKFYKKVLTQMRLVNFFHIPLQSGSNKILSYMKRGYTREEFVEKLNILQKINPFAFIGTDIIVGFLHETDQDFQDTYNFLAQSPISKFHIFRFSKREKTAAYYMSKRIKEPHPEVKIKRAKMLTELGKKKYEQFLSKHLGLSFPALFLERKEENYQEVLLNNQIPAFIKTDQTLTGEIKRVKMERLNKASLLGRLI